MTGTVLHLVILVGHSGYGYNRNNVGGVCVCVCGQKKVLDTFTQKQSHRQHQVWEHSAGLVQLTAVWHGDQSHLSLGVRGEPLQPSEFPAGAVSKQTGGFELAPTAPLGNRDVSECLGSRGVLEALDEPAMKIRLCVVCKHVLYQLAAYLVFNLLHTSLEKRENNSLKSISINTAKTMR